MSFCVGCKAIWGGQSLPVQSLEKWSYPISRKGNKWIQSSPVWGHLEGCSNQVWNRWAWMGVCMLQGWCGQEVVRGDQAAQMKKRGRLARSWAHEGVGWGCRPYVRPQSSPGAWHTSAVPAHCLRTLAQQILENLFHMSTHIQLQIYGQLLFQESRLILKYTWITFNSAENWKPQLKTLKVLTMSHRRWSWAGSLPLVNNRSMTVSLRKGLLAKEQLNPRKRKE